MHFKLIVKQLCMTENLKVIRNMTGTGLKFAFIGFINRFCRNWFLATLSEEGRPEKIAYNLYIQDICICRNTHETGDRSHMFTYMYYMYIILQGYPFCIA